MRQVHLKLLLCLLLAISTTGQLNSANVFNHQFAGSQSVLGETDLNGYDQSSGVNTFGHYGEQSNGRLSSANLINANNFGHYRQSLDAPSTAWATLNDPSNLVQTTVAKQPVQTIAKKQTLHTNDVSPSTSQLRGIQRDQTYAKNSNADQYTGDNNKHGRPYAEPTGPPFGLQSVGGILSYFPEKLDLSKCGPKPTTNPCKPFGSQYHALPNYPNCYIQCTFGFLSIKPCPANLVWNRRIGICDWPTIAPTMDNDDNNDPELYRDKRTKTDSSLNQIANNDYEFSTSYPYGRKKRSTVERKKRNLGSFLVSHQNSMQQPNVYQSGSLSTPWASYILPSPVNYGGYTHFTGVPFQVVGQQPPSQQDNQAAVPTMSPVSQPLLTSTINDPFAQVRNQMQAVSNIPLTNTFYSGQTFQMPNNIAQLTPTQSEFQLVPGPKYPYSRSFDDRTPAAPKTLSIDLVNLLKALLSQQIPPNGFLAQQAASSYTPLAVQPVSLLKSGFGQTYSSSFMPISTQLLPYGFQSLQAANSYERSLLNQKSKLDLPEKGYMDLSIEIENDASNEDEDEDEDEDGWHVVDTSSDKGSSKDKKNKTDASKQSTSKRTKRQFDASSASNGQAPFIDRKTAQQSRLASNYLQIRPSFQSSPCIGKRSGSNTAHPTDNTKYIGCINRYYFKEMACPTGLVYNAPTNRCEKRMNPDAICARERPCMNGGQCYPTSSQTYKCVCNGGWTGERCETQFSSCANNPCGSDNECQTLKTDDYKQDYVCICGENQSYGSSCGGNTIKNPCIAAATTSEQYHQFVFSKQAFIQCNGDFLYVRSCASGLIWNVKDKICDHSLTTLQEDLLPKDDAVPNDTVLLDQTTSQLQPNQQQTYISEQKQSKFNRLKHISPIPTNNYDEIAHEQSIPMDQSTSSSILTTSTEASKQYDIKSAHGDQYYEPPQVRSLNQRSFRRYQHLGQSELPVQVNPQYLAQEYRR